MKRRPARSASGRPARIIALAAAGAACLAPSLIADPVYLPAEGYSARPVYRSADGPIYAFWGEADGTLFVAEGSIVRRVDADGTRSDLYNDAMPLFPAALRRSGPSLIVAASLTGDLLDFDAAGPAGQTPTAIMPAPGLWDLEQEPSGTWLASANPLPFPGADNRISRLSLTQQQQTTLVHTGGYSGPLALDANGNLVYGTADAGNARLYLIAAADLAAPAVPIELTDLTPIATGLPAVTDLALDADPLPDIFMTSYEGRILQIDEHRAVTEFGEFLGATPSNLQFLPAPGRFEPGPDRAGYLLASGTDWGTGVSVIYAIAPIPEPASAALACMALCLGAGGRLARRRAKPRS